jgi:RNA polymerase sigma-70 factor (ECF subfamily)
MKDRGLASRKQEKMAIALEPEDGTSSSMLRRIKSLSDATSWARFYELYSPMIQRFALKSGLTAVEAQDVVQNTMLNVTREIGEFQYDRTKGSFKTWLFNCVRWRIVDAFRARPKNMVQLDKTEPQGNGEGRSWEPSESVFEKIWDDEWSEQLRREALEEVKKKASSAHFQIFYLYAVEGMASKQVAEMVGTSVAQVYLVRCRLGRMFKKQLSSLKHI